MNSLRIPIVLPFLVLIAAASAGVTASLAPATGHAHKAAFPIYGVTIPPGYRDRELIATTHEEGSFNQLRPRSFLHQAKEDSSGSVGHRIED